jgi:hypothetical protein
MLEIKGKEISKKVKKDFIFMGIFSLKFSLQKLLTTKKLKGSLNSPKKEIFCCLDTNLIKK